MGDTPSHWHVGDVLGKLRCHCRWLLQLLLEVVNAIWGPLLWGSGCPSLLLVLQRRFAVAILIQVGVWEDAAIHRACGAIGKRLSEACRCFAELLLPHGMGHEMQGHVGAGDRLHSISTQLLLHIFVKCQRGYHSASRTLLYCS